MYDTWSGKSNVPRGVLFCKPVKIFFAKIIAMERVSVWMGLV